MRFNFTIYFAAKFFLGPLRLEHFKFVFDQEL